MHNIFYATFMQKQAFKNRFVKIEAPTYEAAHNAMAENFGMKYMTIYSYEEFLPQIEKYGLSELVTIKVIDYGRGDHHSYGFELIEAEANARLIAAAPELLEHLKKMTDMLMSCGEGFIRTMDEDFFEDVCAAQDAIAKAKGE